ncbi:penicillin-binding protein 2 [Megamonas hypermegale]|uniref:penicillin-binding protein 2 n=1 Tax=Megamonas hypermegale TaxID=158847 RepID=UPI000B39B11C|nr:penicillin-binding protein 2 [Megamonas hypermegale]OUO41132.1 penicillin-binding protein 2 [Megamonas hypermegale]
MKFCDKRLKILAIILILIIVALISRLVYLQIYQGEYFGKLADGNRIRLVSTSAPRGIIYDRNDVPLVNNRPAFTVELLPSLEPVSPEVVDRLAKLLNLNAEDINNKIANHSGFDPVTIKVDVTPEIISVIEEQQDLYPGVFIDTKPVRNYIYKTEGVHVLGYVSEISDSELEDKKKSGDDSYKLGDIIGKFGLEKYYDTYLRGTPGGEQVEVDVTGRPVQRLGMKEPVAGNNLRLTIDYHLQDAAERAMDEVLGQIGAQAAAAVVLNPQTGEVLAMVSRPNFDPNLFALGISTKDWNVINNNPHYPLDNKAVTGEYPPGSTFKIITGTAALMEKVVTPDELIFDSGQHWIIPKTNADGEALGYINFVQALAHSDNVYFYEMGNRLGIDRLAKWARLFGIGEKTGIDLSYEASGNVACPEYKRKVFDEEWYLAETFDASIGQGFTLATPLQMAVVMSEAATGGKKYKPYLVRDIFDSNGNVIKHFDPVLVRDLNIDPAIAQLVQQGLHEVSTIGTAASMFRDFPVPIAGKTGTAENSQGREHGWFVAYGPFDNPNIAVAVIVENAGYGATSAVPIGHKILTAAFGLDKPQDQQQQANANGNAPAQQ